MLDTRPALDRLGISTTSAMHAVQQVRLWIEDGAEADRLNRTNDLLERILGVKLTMADVNDRPVATPITYAVTIAQAAVEATIQQSGMVDNVDLLMSNARARADKFITNPSHKWMFAVPETTETSTEQVAVADGIDVKVAVKADGKIKKGGKEILAIALYEKHVKNAATPVDNQGFIAILMKELGMSKAGATTYNYNMKKKFGGTITAKAKK
jgi:hypothetical protein